MKNKKGLHRFIPKEYLYLLNDKKIEYNNINLKTDYLIDIMHELILKYLFTNELKFNLWSKILRNKYGKYYSHYIQYLVDYKFMFFVSNYYVSKKAKTYKLNITDLDITRCKINDNILIKKYNNNNIIKSFIYYGNNSIDNDLKKKMIEDLYKVDIDYTGSLKYLNILKDSKEINLNQYYKNLNSIESINNKQFYYIFDDFGRFHTNFTILKKYIRQNFLTINGNILKEVDVKNSQPYFFGVFLKKEIGENNFNNDVKYYIDAVKNGLIYNIFCDKYPNIIKDRNQAKIMLYKVLFGRNYDNKIENILFKNIFPTVYDYIKEFKSYNESYKELSHELQLLESNFIFNDVCKTIKKLYPHINIITIHDSILFEEKYINEVELIFNNKLSTLL